MSAIIISNHLVIDGFDYGIIGIDLELIEIDYDDQCYPYFA